MGLEVGTEYWIFFLVFRTDCCWINWFDQIMVKTQLLAQSSKEIRFGRILKYCWISCYSSINIMPGRHLISFAHDGKQDFLIELRKPWPLIQRQFAPEDVMADNAASVGGGESSIRWTLRRHLEEVRPLSPYRKTQWRCCPGDKEGVDYDDIFFLFLSAFQQIFFEVTFLH